MPDAKPPKKHRRNDWSHFIVQHTPGAVLTTDPRGRITEFNPAAEHITGYRREEAMGQAVDKILNCQGAEPGTLGRLLAGKIEATQELVLRNRSGEEVPVMGSCFGLRDEANGFLGAAIIIRDLTLVKRLETERRHLVNMFAHDLKTPIVGVAGLIRRLHQGKAGPLTQEQKTYLDTMDREMSRLEKLITSFLEFARLDLRLLTPQPEAITVPEECREVILLLTPLAEAKGMKLDARFPANLPALSVDPLLFRRVLENLLGNAIKFSPPGKEVRLEVWDDDREVRFAVQDQGPGIPPEDVPHLFEFFYRGKAAAGQPGFGLGLATVKRIIDSHSGRVWVESTPGQGASFYFTLPKKSP
jgi:two-component system phosphate regulon sensor histidine kinase PhoR